VTPILTLTLPVPAEEIGKGYEGVLPFVAVEFLAGLGVKSESIAKPEIKLGEAKAGFGSPIIQGKISRPLGFIGL